MNSKDLTAALLQVPDQDRGAVLAAHGCTVASTQAAPSEVDARERR